MTDAAELYLDLLKGCLSRSLFLDEEMRPVAGRRPWHHVLQKALRQRGIELVRPAQTTAAIRAEGREWPPYAETMIGTKRLDNLQRSVTDVIRSRVPGDVIETGVWRGGGVIFMRAILKAYGETDRVVWVADSFRGLPKPDDAYPADRGDKHWTHAALAVPLEQVKRNFLRYGLLDEQVRFLVGWFKDTLPTAPIERLAVLRLDGDMYESTMEALDALYPKLSVGGYCIVDDYGGVAGCRAAVEDYRRAHGITEPIEAVDWTGVYWRRAGK